jgi:pimeloyl-ACP methyl ester carboxylesterase
MATFLLVHGTFAQSANWPALQEGLAEEAREGGEKASFKQLAWSGKNRAAARESAASAILKSVQEIQSNSSNEKIFLIGHSHGGSAIAYFLKEHPEAANTLAGCAFLSTPFVAIRPRRNAFRLMALLLFFPYIFFVNIIPPPYYDISSPEDLPPFGHPPICSTGSS